MQVLMTAIHLSKQKPTLALDLPTLLMDTAHVFRSWDLQKYANQCLQLCVEAAAYAVEYHGPESKVHAVVINNRGAIEIELDRLDAAGETLTLAGQIFQAAGVPADDPDYIAYLQNVAALRERLEAGGQRTHRLAGITRRYPFLDYGFEHVPWADIKPLEDEVFVELARKRAAEEAGTAQALSLERAMKARVGELFRALESGANTLRLYPFLPTTLNGIYVESLNLQDDIFFAHLTQTLAETTDLREHRRLSAKLSYSWTAARASWRRSGRSWPRGKKSSWTSSPTW
ncbi:hypothetical protein STCU_12095 [Strigomonas culicis]|uniref:Uncharacterized protein n=1 Tax=Strigomonas culicis TaxID=28005 RepID=S9TG71_9TRYP|nr:hypothetical protein STCU_12095 [Strigomonas culicis]|eukprot:EPY15348.1 hypothetical protein STCU_12095 [Strigomonas culicis]